MNAKKTVRVVLDVALTAMIVFEMFIQYTGEFLHEVVGFAFFASVILHLALSATWMKKTAASAKRGTLTGRRTALAVMGMLLAITMVVLGVSSIAISGILADAGFVWSLGSYATWATIHAVSSYALSALVVVHLAMHWVFLASAFKVPYDPSRRRAIGTGVHAVAAVGALALGIMAAREVLPREIIASTDATQATGNSENTTFQDGAVSDLKNPPNTSEGDSSTSNSSSAASPRGGKHGRNIATDDTSSEPEQHESDTAPEAYTETYVEEPEPVASEAPATTTTGICTLCRKQCPLSAPQCNKPYEAGLL